MLLNVDKSFLRGLILKNRQNLGLSQRQKKSDVIKNKLFALKEFKKAKGILFYCSFSSEVITFAMIEEALSAGKKVFLPLCAGRTLEARQIQSINDVSPGYVGILEPKPGTRIVDPKEIDLVIVPGVCFDAKGFRIGYGKGFYDRFLKNLPDVAKVGLSYDLQIVSNLEHESHDIPVDKVITENRVINS